MKFIEHAGQRRAAASELPDQFGRESVNADGLLATSQDQGVTRVIPLGGLP